jgi:hypothetical protein
MPMCAGTGRSSDLSTPAEFRDVLARPERERLNRHRRLTAAGRDEAAAVAEKQVRYVVAAMLAIDDRRRRIVAHAAGAEQVHRVGLLVDRRP